MPAAEPASLTWSRVFPDRTAQVREARRFLAGILAQAGLPGQSGIVGDAEIRGWPAIADDAIQCLSELVANAVAHSNSAKPGGTCTVRVHLRAGRLRAEVRDQGGPWIRPASGDGQRGRGLLIVGELAAAWGRAGSSEEGWTLWFEMDAPGRPGHAGAASRWVTVLDGRRLRQLRRERGLSQAQLADRAGMSPATIGRLERQPAASCRSRTAARLAGALGADPGGL
ncbi:MAG: ATP-binding protein [Streptosporangiales bacterium]